MFWKRAFSGTMTAFLLISLLSLTFTVQISKSEDVVSPKLNAMSSFWAGTVWNKTYGGTGSDQAITVIQTTDGGYALAGVTNSSGSGNYDSWLVKTDSVGNMQWNKTYGGTGYEAAYTVVQTVDGGYALVGYTTSFGAGSSDCWLIKTDFNGVMQWNKTYGGTNYDYGIRVIQTSDGGYALAGQTYSFGAGSIDFWLVKTDSAGTMQWNKTYGGTNYDYPLALIQTTDGGYALAGYTGLYPNVDSWLVKTDSSGNMQWNKTYGGTGYDVTWSVVQTADGGYALGGYTSDDLVNIDMWLVNTDSSGNMQWNKTYGGVSIDFAFSIIQTSDFGYALAGYTGSYGAGKEDFWLIKLTPTTIYIRADGSVDPSTAPIQRNGNLYTLTDNIYTSATYGIVIERNNITLNGAGYTVQGIRASGSRGIYLSGRNNVTIQSMEIKAFWYGILLDSSLYNSISRNTVTNNSLSGIVIYHSNYNSISDNNITNNDDGIYLNNWSSNNSITGNNIINNGDGIVFIYWSKYNTISQNNITNNGQGLVFSEYSSNNNIFRNIITNTWRAIELYRSSYNSISENNITANSGYAIYLSLSLNSSIYHNNFVNNVYQVYTYSSENSWDDGYPSGGNYWSNYNGTDLYRGPNKDQLGSDAIGDIPYVINVNNQDHYPLMGFFGSATPTGDDVAVFPKEDVSLVFKKVERKGSTRVKEFGGSPPLPSGRVLVGPYYDIKTTASYSGVITIRIIYDDTGLTPEQESSLQLAHWLLLGDITGETPNPYEFISDGKVDIKDIAIIAKYFGQNVPPAPPECDISGPTLGMPDGKIDIRDVALAAINFGKTAQAIDITTYLDTENNVIYGETDHLSIFGVHRFG